MVETATTPNKVTVTMILYSKPWTIIHICHSFKKSLPPKFSYMILHPFYALPQFSYMARSSLYALPQFSYMVLHTFYALPKIKNVCKSPNLLVATFPTYCF